MDDKARKNYVGSLVGSRLVGRLFNLPPVSWLVQGFTRALVRRQLSANAVHSASSRPAPPRIAGVGLDVTLKQIVSDVVEALGYAGAMVATYEQGDILPVRALHVDPAVATDEQIHRWEEEVSRYAPRPVSITDPEIARVHVYGEEYQDNLSVQAFQARGPVISDDLFDLFTPIAPPASRPVVKGIQQALGIQQVIAVPFFLETVTDGRTEQEMVGNLFAAKRGLISEQDIRVLSAFGRQAAAAIESERRRLHIQIAQNIVYEMQSRLQNEEQVLQRIVRGAVSDLGYVGAMVATYEQDDSLPVRAFYLQPSVGTMEQVQQWEKELSRYSGRPVSVSDPDIARVFVHREDCAANLSVRAFKAEKPVVSSDLYDLFTPVVPPSARPAVAGIQEALGIQQVIAVPFFLEEEEADGQVKREAVGNLFAATRSRRFSAGEIELLETLAHQAAAGIRNARLYRIIEERRQVAQVFGKMAFSAAASVHALRNHLAAFQMHLHLVQLTPPERRDEIFQLSNKMLERLDEAAKILDNLHEPWRAVVDKPTDVNSCITQAIGQAVRDREEVEAEEGIYIREELGDGLPPVQTSPDMLAEAFRVLIKNGVEAVRETGRGGEVRVVSRRGEQDTVEVLISDEGVGIKPEDMGKIFELRWSTKEAGMGFGLFWTKEFVEGLGGSITVESEWQQGTTFRLVLPAIAG